MVKHTQTIRRQIADELSVFDHFVGLVLKGLTITLKYLMSWIIEQSHERFKLGGSE